MHRLDFRKSRKPGTGAASTLAADSAGLWMRLYAMYRDGEIASSLNAAGSLTSSFLSSIGDADATRLTSTVEACFDIFETNHGGHEGFIAAWYQ